MKKLFVALCLTCCSFALSGQVWINEFMQSNIDLVIDDLNDFPDSWVELYNESEDTVSIKGWYLSDKANYTKGWQFDVDTFITPKGFLLIYCDKAETGLHTSFRLESGNGGAIYLFDEEGELLDEVTGFAKQPAPNIARGRTTDGADTWEYFVKATPNEPNAGETATKLLPSPMFSETGGVFLSEVTLALSLPDGAPDDVTTEDIYYTTNGAEPTEESLQYTGEITIAEPTAIRAKIIKPGYLINRSATHTYIVTDREFTLPIISLNTDSAFWYDPEIGIYTKGAQSFGDANYSFDWRRPMHIEYFSSAEEKSVINQLEEGRISGGVTRQLSQKSMILYANKRFGEKRYDYQLFADKPGQEIKSFILRNSGNDFANTAFRDAAIQLFMGGKVDIDYQAHQPAIVFVNGKYHGIQNLRERSNEDFVVSNYNGEENIDMMENWPGNDLKAGDRVAFNELIERINSPTQYARQRLLETVDTEEFINYMILQIFVANTDFPHNNVVLWRMRDNGKWRFILKDLDFGLGLYNVSRTPDYDAIAFNINDNDRPRKLFNALMMEDSFQKEFYDRFAVYMGDFMSVKNTVQVIDSLQQVIVQEMPFHIDRWVQQWHSNVSVSDMDGWNSEVDRMRQWLIDRYDHMYDHLAQHYGAAGTTVMKVRIPEEIQNPPTIHVNGIPLINTNFTGKFYLGKDVTIGWNEDQTGMHGWRITTASATDTISRDYYSKEVTITIPEDCLELRATVLMNPESIETPDHPEIKVYAGENRIHISGLEGETAITLYDMNGRKLSEVKTAGYGHTIPFYSKGVIFVQINNKTQKTTRKIIVR